MKTFPSTRPLPFHSIGRALPLALLCFSVGCGPNRTTESVPAPKPLPVRVTPVENEGRTATEEVVGTVRARLRAAVEAKVSGRIEALTATPGQLVRKGDTLAVLDAREIRARLDSAQATLEQTTRDLKRITRLTQDGAATPADEDATLARQRIAIATVAEADTLLGHTRVVAPFDGVITRKLAEVGDLAAPGRSLLEIEDPGQLRFEADIPEALVDGVQLGAKLPVRLSSAKERIEGIVSEIAPMAESMSRTYLVKLDLPPGPTIRAGQFGRVAVPTGEVTVPRVLTSAIVVRGQLEYVFVVEAGKARLRLIRSGKTLGNSVEVVAGLNPGEKVISTPADDLRDGRPVEVNP